MSEYEDPYTKRELDEWRRDVREVLVRIEMQTTRTNGRVSKLEKWQGYVLGFCGCLTIITLPIVLAIITHYIR